MSRRQQPAESLDVFHAPLETPRLDFRFHQPDADLQTMLPARLIPQAQTAGPLFGENAVGSLGGNRLGQLRRNAEPVALRRASVSLLPGSIEPSQPRAGFKGAERRLAILGSDPIHFANWAYFPEISAIDRRFWALIPKPTVVILLPIPTPASSPISKPASTVGDYPIA